MELPQIRLLPISELRPADYNPRRVLQKSARNYRKLKRSIEEFGLVEPLIWNELTGRLVGGHMRLSILKDLNYAEVPVSVVRLSEEREKALNVILNNREAQGRFDPVKLRNLLEELSPLPELPLTGFELSDLGSLNLSPVTANLASSDEDFVEITLRMSAGCYQTASPQIDSLIREFDLESHVRRSK